MSINRMMNRDTNAPAIAHPSARPAAGRGTLRHWLQALSKRLGNPGKLFPRPDCLLCGAPAGVERRSPATPLCSACAADLPSLDAERCPRCAHPAPGGHTCGTCLSEPPHFDATVAHWRYDFPLDGLIQALKYGHRLALADFFAASLLEGPIPAGDLLLPVPLSPARLRERGFNQAVEIGRPLARACSLPLALDACVRPGDTPPQAALPWKQRRKNIRHAFECRRDLTGRHVIVLDDVMTTGATLDELARTLKHHGAATVTNWVLARTLRDHHRTATSPHA